MDNKIKSLIKSVDKLDKSMSLSKYIEFNTALYNITDNNRVMYIMSDIQYKKQIRYQIVKTLQDNDFIRKDKWTQTSVIGFLHQVFEAIEGKENLSDEDKEAISKMYNVPKNRINTQAALFINNAIANKDKFGVDLYFSEVEIAKYKYHNIYKMQQDIEDNKIPQKFINILKQLDMIV